MASNTDHHASGLVDESLVPLNRMPNGVRLFDLHDPALPEIWSSFLAATPMLNDQLLPVSLQTRLARTVSTYRSLTAVDEPAFFVATYFDLLTERLLLGDGRGENTIVPMQVCPVFSSGAAASVSDLLAAVTGLSKQLFVNAPGRQARYRDLFLLTEYSHCKFLTSVGVAGKETEPEQLANPSERQLPNIAFSVDTREYAALVNSKEELRAILETVGDIDATRAFRTRWPATGTADEADVLHFIRLLSLLANDSKNGYVAIPVLFPLLSDSGQDPGAPVSLAVGDALDLAYRLRASFRELVPFRIADADDLKNATLAVSYALENTSRAGLIDAPVASLLAQFVSGSELLLGQRTTKYKSAADLTSAAP